MLPWSNRSPAEPVLRRPGGALNTHFTLVGYGRIMGQRLHGLEAVRGVAALIVVWRHVGLLSGEMQGVTRWFDEGYLAVDLFFMLSGFVLARTYEGRMPGTIAFTAQRYIRLWPLIAGGVVLGSVYFALTGMATGAWAINLLAGLAILPIIGLAIAFNPPAWSIFCELFANAMHALGLRRMSVAALGAISLICAIVLWEWLPAVGMDVSDGENFWLGLPRVMLSYCMGVALYRLNGDRAWCPAILAWPAIALYALLVAAYPQALEGPFEILFVIVVHPLLLLASLSLRQSSVGVVLGGLSFPLYALHFPLLLLVFSVGLHWTSAFAAAIAGSALIGALIDWRWRAQLIGLVQRRSAKQAVA